MLSRGKKRKDELEENDIQENDELKKVYKRVWNIISGFLSCWNQSNFAYEKEVVNS